MKVVIDTDQITLLKDKADKIFFDPKGEDVIIELYELQAQIEEAIKQAKLKIETEGLKLDPEFSSIKSDRIKIMYRSYGSRYKIDQSRINELDKSLYKTKTTYVPDVKAIDSYIESNDGKIPLGIESPDRIKQVSIKIKDDESEVKS